MAETAIPTTPALEDGVALVDFNAHVHTFEVNYTCALKRTVGLEIPDSTVTFITFPLGQAEEIIDPLNWHSLTENTERITVTKTGLYLVCFNVHFYLDKSGEVNIEFIIKKNNTTNVFVSAGVQPKSYNNTLSSSFILNLSNGDYIYLTIFHEAAPTSFYLSAEETLFSATLLR